MITQHEITVAFQGRPVGTILVEQKRGETFYQTRAANSMVATFRSETEARDHLLFHCGLEAAGRKTAVERIKDVNPVMMASLMAEAARHNTVLMKELCIALAWIWSENLPEDHDDPHA